MMMVAVLVLAAVFKAFSNSMLEVTWMVIGTRAKMEAKGELDTQVAVETSIERAFLCSSPSLF